MTRAAAPPTAPPPPDGDDVVEGLKGIGGWLDDFWRLPVGTVSTFAVFRACRRSKDPLPSFRVLGKRLARIALLRAWAGRQNPAQMVLFVSTDARKPQ